MEQSLPLSGLDVLRKASVRQTIAAVIFVVELVWGGWLYPYLMEYLRTTSELMLRSYENGIMPLVLKSFSILLMLAGYVLLIPGAANRATKTALLLLCFGRVLMVLVCVLFYVLQRVYDYNPTISLLAVIVPIVLGVLNVYAFSVILRSNELDRNTASWIRLLIVGLCVSFMFSLLYNLLWGREVSELYETGFGSLFTLFHVVWDVLLIVVYVRFARCAAFSGAGASEPAGVWSPVNRYMAAAIVAPAVTLLALWALFRVAAPWLSSL